jgi:hypothetical protein
MDAGRGLVRRIMLVVSPRWWLVRHPSRDAMLWLASYAAFGYGSTPYCTGAKPFVSVVYGSAP